MPEDKMPAPVDNNEPIPVVIVEIENQTTITEEEKANIIENQEPIPIVVVEEKKKGFFSKERVKSRWKKIFSFLWPLVEDSVKTMVKEEVEERLGSKDKTRVPARERLDK